MPFRKYSGCLLLVFALLPGVAHAHDPFQSYATAQLQPTRLELSLRLSMVAAEALLDPPPVPLLSEENFAAEAPRLKAGAAKLFRLTSAAGDVPMQSASVNRTEENDVEFVLEYPRPPSGRLSFTLAYLQKMTEDHNATLSVSDEAGANLGWEELSPGQPVYVATLPPDAKTAASAPPVPVKSLFGRFVLLGIKHILTGYDHLLFLAGLLVVCRRLKTMVTIITCFTVAHSITLALAALGLVAVSGRIVEPLIAASIVFVGVENLLRSGEPRGRWLLTAGFGLIHGFGFAGALIEAGLGSNGTPMLVPLFSFNLGVELGQLTVAAVFVPILWQIRKWPPFARHGTTIISVLIALAGGYWFLERTLLSS